MAYPAALDSFAALTDGVDDVLASHQNDRGDAIENIQIYLGTNASQTTPVGTGRILNSTSASASTWTATPTIGTSVTVPLVVGGTAVGSTLTLKSTSGVGTTDVIIFQVGNNGATEAMRIINSGFVGIGGSPSNKLDIQGAVSATPVTNGIVRILTTGANPATGSGGGLLFAQQDSVAAYVNYASITGTRVDASSNNKVNLVISTGAPTDGIAIASRLVIDTAGAMSLSLAAFAVGATYSSGNGIFVQNSSTNNAISTASQGAGTTTLYIGNASINVTSDIRLKENIYDTQVNALDLIDKLHVIDYTWSPKWSGYSGYAHRGVFTGMVAQELIKIIPTVVNANGGENCELCLSGQECENHGEWHVEYDHLVPMMVKAIQDLRKENKELKEALYNHIGQ